MHPKRIWELGFLIVTNKMWHGKQKRISYILFRATVIGNQTDFFSSFVKISGIKTGSTTALYANNMGGIVSIFYVRVF